MAEPGPTERQPKETAPAYRAFREYLLMGSDRSTAKVARALGKSKTLIDRWSSRNGWVARCREFESSIAKAEDDATRGELAKRAERQAQIATAHQEVGAFLANAVVQRIARERDAGQDPFRDIDMATMLQLDATLARAHHRAVVTERLARGMTTDQPGEPMPRSEAEQQAARLSDSELDARLGAVDQVAEQRAKREQKAAAS